MARHQGKIDITRGFCQLFLNNISYFNADSESSGLQ